MTDFEILMIFMELADKLLNFGVFLFALLTFLDQRNKRKK